jgi:hypothetical protein
MGGMTVTMSNTLSSVRHLSTCHRGPSDLEFEAYAKRHDEKAGLVVMDVYRRWSWKVHHRLDETDMCPCSLSHHEVR